MQLVQLWANSVAEWLFIYFLLLILYKYLSKSDFIWPISYAKVDWNFSYTREYEFSNVYFAIFLARRALLSSKF